MLAPYRAWPGFALGPLALALVIATLLGILGAIPVTIARSASDVSLAYGTYLGGSADDEAYGVALDAQGNIYLTGRTYSDNFPRTGGARASGRDIFVTKLDPTGRQVLYSTIIGGRAGDDGLAIAVTAAGEAVVTAYTASDNFPQRRPRPRRQHSPQAWSTSASALPSCAHPARPPRPRAPISSATSLPPRITPPSASPSARG